MNSGHVVGTYVMWAVSWLVELVVAGYDRTVGLVELRNIDCWVLVKGCGHLWGAVSGGDGEAKQGRRR
jgi:hypothetical protein